MLLGDTPDCVGIEVAVELVSVVNRSDASGH